MAVEIVMPKWGLSMQEGLITQWLKQEGEPIAKGEAVLEVETEKMTNVVEAPESGILAKILYPAGTQVPVTQIIALITAPGEAVPEFAAPAPAGAAADAAASNGAAAAPAPAAPPAAPPTGAIPAMPAARRLAKEHGIDLATIQGSGANGAITKEDVERALAARGTQPMAATPAKAGIIPATPVARRLAKEWGIDLATVTGSGPNGAITKEDVERAREARPTPVAPALLPVQKVSFYSDGYRLDGLLYNPKNLGSGERRPAVVLCVGYTYLKTMVMPDIAKALTAAGYVAMVFDYRGFGDSEGPRGRLIPSEQVNDARAALTFLAGLPQVDLDRLAVAGISLGGSNAIAVGALDQRVGAVVALEPMGDGERWLRSLRRHWEWQDFQARLAQDRSQRVRTGQSQHVDPMEIVLPDPGSRSFLEQVAAAFPQMKVELPLESAAALIEFRPEALISRLSPRPCLIIHGDADQLIPVSEAHSLADYAGFSCQLEIIAGMGHFDWVAPNSPGFARVAELVVNFLQEVLPIH